jgi:hypothetical protein
MLMAQIGDQTHLTLSFGQKLNLAPCSTPLYFFRDISNCVTYFGQIGDPRAVFQRLYG